MTNNQTQITSDAIDFMTDELAYEIVNESPLVFEKQFTSVWKDTVKELGHLRQLLEANGFHEEVMNNVYEMSSDTNTLRG